MVSGRIVNVLVPHQLDVVTTELMGEGEEKRIISLEKSDQSENAMG